MCIYIYFVCLFSIVCDCRSPPPVCGGCGRRRTNLGEKGWLCEINEGLYKERVSGSKLDSAGSESVDEVVDGSGEREEDEVDWARAGKCNQ